MSTIITWPANEQPPENLGYGFGATAPGYMAAINPGETCCDGTCDPLSDACKGKTYFTVVNMNASKVGKIVTEFGFCNSAKAPSGDPYGQGFMLLSHYEIPGNDPCLSQCLATVKSGIMYVNLNTSPMGSIWPQPFGWKAWFAAPLTPGGAPNVPPYGWLAGRHLPIPNYYVTTTYPWVSPPVNTVPYFQNAVREFISATYTTGVLNSWYVFGFNPNGTVTSTPLNLSMDCAGATLFAYPGSPLDWFIALDPAVGVLQTVTLIDVMFGTFTNGKFTGLAAPVVETATVITPEQLWRFDATAGTASAEWLTARALGKAMVRANFTRNGVPDNYAFYAFSNDNIFDPGSYYLYN